MLLWFKLVPWEHLGKNAQMFVILVTMASYVLKCATAVLQFVTKHPMVSSKEVLFLGMLLSVISI